MRELRNDNTLKYFVTNITKQIGKNCKKIILFGSRARGDDTEESDYDFLIVVSEVSPQLKNTIDSLCGEILFQYNKVFSVVIISEEKYVQQIYNPLLINIRKEGKPL